MQTDNLSWALAVQHLLRRRTLTHTRRAGFSSSRLLSAPGPAPSAHLLEPRPHHAANHRAPTPLRWAGKRVNWRVSEPSGGIHGPAFPALWAGKGGAAPPVFGYGFPWWKDVNATCRLGSTARWGLYFETHRRPRLCKKLGPSGVRFQVHSKGKRGNKAPEPASFRRFPDVQ